MMIIVGVLKNTGVFQWCAYVSYKLAKGKVFVLAVYLMIFTAFSSAFLDNVTTMLLLTGVAIEICISLSINPLHLLIPLVLASNIGGTATLIGDPPNIMIGSYAGLTFMHFVEALAMICLGLHGCPHHLHQTGMGKELQLRQRWIMFRNISRISKKNTGSPTPNSSAMAWRCWVLPSSFS